MHNKINEILATLFGIKITRVIRPQSLTAKNKDGNNLIVEFFGPSGVGKSTLCQHYLKHHKTKFKREILTRHDLYRYHKGTRFTLNGIQDRALKIKINNTASKDLDPILKYQEICHFKPFMDHDFLIKHYLHHKIIFLDEERLLHYFLDEEEQFTEDEVLNYIKNRVFIYCYGSPKKLVTHIKKRSKKVKLVWVHRELDDLQLLDYVEKQLEKEQRRYEKLNEIGAKAIKLNVDDSIDENTSKLDIFLDHTIKAQN